MDQLSMFVLERERYEVLLREAELARLARARGASHRQPSPRRPVRWPHPRVAVGVARRLNRRLADAVR
jgi:hypothetical protein